MSTPDAEALDREEMRQLAAGRDEALNALMARHATPVFHFLCRWTGSEEEAEDLAQETFVRVYQHRASFRPNDKFTAWLYTIAANLARNHHRWQSRHPTISLETAATATGQEIKASLPSSTSPPDESLGRTEQAAAVQNAVRQLPEDLREAIVLCELQDLPVAEAAAILKTSPKAVESRLYRARKLLRGQLARWLN